MTVSTEESRAGTALEEFVAAVEGRILQEIASVSAAEPARALAAAGGKHLRARLLWLSAAAAAPKTIARRHERLVRTATAIELAHLGSLIHDDIVDGAETRRGVPAVHLRRGTVAAFHAGVALLHLASALVAPLSSRSRRSLAYAILGMCRGQVRELMGLFQPCTRSERLAIMRDKTAALFEATASLGSAVVGGSPEARQALRAFGRALGIAYQISDDIMDLVGDPAQLGRANGDDLWHGVMTLPVLIARERCGAVDELLHRIEANGHALDVEQCLCLIRDTGAIEAAVEERRRWIAKASEQVSSMPSSAARNALVLFAENLMRTRIAARTQVSDAHPRCRPDPPLRFCVSDTRVLPASSGSARSGKADRVRDPLIRAHLAWIEPTLADSVHDVTRDAPGVVLTARIPSSVLEHPRDRVAVDSAECALALARSIASTSSLTRSPVRVIVIADCLEAVAFACLAKGHSAMHASVTQVALADLCRECKPWESPWDNELNTRSAIFACVAAQ